MSRFKRHLSSLMLGRHSVREPTENNIPASKAQQPTQNRPGTASTHTEAKSQKQSVRQSSGRHLKNGSHNRYDSASSDTKSVSEPATQSASGSARREQTYGRSWRRKLDPDVLAELRYACYALDALIQTGQPAAPAKLTAAVEAASAPKQSSRRRPEQQKPSSQAPPPVTAAHRSRAVSNPAAPHADQSAPLPALHAKSQNHPRMPTAAPGVLLSSAFSKAEESQVRSKTVQAPAAVELPCTQPAVKMDKSHRHPGTDSGHDSHDSSRTVTRTTAKSSARSQAPSKKTDRPASRSGRATSQAGLPLAHPQPIVEPSDESYSTPVSVSDRAVSTARTSLPATPSGKSVTVPASPPKKSAALAAVTAAGQVVSPDSPAPVVPLRSSNRHSRRPSSNIIVPPNRGFNVTISQPADSPAVSGASQPAGGSEGHNGPKMTLRSIGSQVFKLRSRKSKKNLQSTETDSASGSTGPPETGRTGQSWKSTLHGLKSRASRLSLRDYSSSTNLGSHSNGSAEQEQPPMPPLETISKYSNTHNNETGAHSTAVAAAEENVSRPVTAHSHQRSGSHLAAEPTEQVDGAATQDQPTGRAHRTFSTIRNNLRKSRSSIFLGRANATTTALPPMPSQAHVPASGGLPSEPAETKPAAAPPTGQGEPGKLRRMLSALQFSNPNRLATESTPDLPKARRDEAVETEELPVAEPPTVRY